MKNSTLVILKGLFRLRQLSNHPEMPDDFQDIKNSLADKFFNPNNPLKEIIKEEIMSLFK
ncbi:MAG: hypothetical protein GX820_05775 [Bacteroidales bacterium]|nr:hypothetical protein [Bacteroidales bacterium]